MKWSFIVSVVAAVVLLTLALAALVVWRSSQAIHSASEDVRAEREFRFVTQ
jgi:flagellar basal body-associated protein FliL